MLDGTHFFECKCYSDEHTLKFILDKEEKEIYTSVYLQTYGAWYRRVWLGIKYIFGYKCKYGSFDVFLLQEEDAKRLIKLLEEIIE